jgi:hypothetical protein
MTYFLKQPAGIFLRSDEELLSVGKDLPVGNYGVNVTPTGEFYLKQVDAFTRPSRIYGSMGTTADRIMRTFSDRTASTGVLLSGEQGSGKTQLAKELSIRAALLVSIPACGATFNQFIQQITTPAVVIIDEFEKLYDSDDQQKLLTLLDGTYPTKKLFVLTCNNMYRIDQHMLNRPGRLFYHLRYKGLEERFIREYCADRLDAKEHTDGIVKLSHAFNAFNFDMLKALVEEMNRFRLTARDALSMMNISPDHGDDENFFITLEFDGNAVPTRCHRSVVECNPLQPFSTYHDWDYATVVTNDDSVPDAQLCAPPSASSLKRKPVKGAATSGWQAELQQLPNEIDWSPAELVEMRIGGSFVFQKGKLRMTLVRKQQTAFSYQQLAF